MQDSLTPKEVSKLLRISVATVYRYLKSGFLKGTKTPEGIRVSRADLKKIVGNLVGTGRASPSKLQ